MITFLITLLIVVVIGALVIAIARWILALLPFDQSMRNILLAIIALVVLLVALQYLRAPFAGIAYAGLVSML